MDVEKLETIKLLQNYSNDEIKQIMIIMTYWDDMVNIGIVTKDDINNLSNLPEEKQSKIIDYVSSKIKDKLERNNDGNKEN